MQNFLKQSDVFRGQSPQDLPVQKQIANVGSGREYYNYFEKIVECSAFNSVFLRNAIQTPNDRLTERIDCPTYVMMKYSPV
jgi:hypothetical protein